MSIFAMTHKSVMSAKMKSPNHPTNKRKRLKKEKLGSCKKMNATAFESNETKDTRPYTDNSKADISVSLDETLHTSQHTIAASEKLQEQQVKILSNLKESTTQNEVVPSMQAHNLSSNIETSAKQQLSDIACLFMQHPHDTLTSIAARARFSQRDNVQIVRREWEERFLHEATGAERACVNATSGTCFASSIVNNHVQDPTFALCEFYTESEHAAIKEAGWSWPKSISPCLLCLRAETFARFLQTRCNAMGCLSQVNYAKIGNIVGEPGEYTAASCFLSSCSRYEGVLEPVVIPTIHDYKITSINGTRWLLQQHPRPSSAAPTFFF